MVKKILIFLFVLISAHTGAQTNSKCFNIVDNEILKSEINNYLKISDSIFKHRHEKTPVIVIDSITDTHMVVEIYTETYAPYLLDEKINLFIAINNKPIPVIIPDLDILALSLEAKTSYLKQIFPKQIAFLKRSKYVNGFKRVLVPNLDQDYIKIFKIFRGKRNIDELMRGN